MDRVWDFVDIAGRDVVSLSSRQERFLNGFVFPQVIEYLGILTGNNEVPSFPKG